MLFDRLGLVDSVFGVELVTSERKLLNICGELFSLFCILVETGNFDNLDVPF